MSMRSETEIMAVVSAIEATDPNEEDDELTAQRAALRFALGYDYENADQYIADYVTE
jgi:hypothetical protein